MSAPYGDKRRNRMHLNDAGIPKVVSQCTWHNPQGSVPRKLPSVLVSLKAPGGNGLPKYVLRSIPNPSVNNVVGKSIPNMSVNQALGNQTTNHSVNSGVNSTQDQKAQNNVGIQIRSKKEVKY